MRVEAACGVPLIRMRTVFVTYLLLIVVGLTYFTVVGLTHH
jgi:hypothetical protein